MGQKKKEKKKVNTLNMTATSKSYTHPQQTIKIKLVEGDKTQI